MSAQTMSFLKRLIHFRPYPLIIGLVVLVFASAAAKSQLDLMGLAWYGFPYLFALCFLWPPRWTFRHWIFRNVIAVPLVLIMAVLVIWTEWPLRGHFLLVRPIMDAMADRLESGERIETPVQIGLFRVRMAEMSGWEPVPCLWTKRIRKYDHTGFVRTTPEKVDHQFNLWSSRKLDNHWQFIVED